MFSLSSIDIRGKPQQVTVQRSVPARRADNGKPPLRPVDSVGQTKMRGVSNDWGTSESMGGATVDSL